MYFECHVTLQGDKDHIKPIVESTGWTFSAIDGDPNMGDGVKCYATTQLNATKFDCQQAVNAVEQCANVLHAAGMTILRKKVELVVFDSRRDKVKVGL